MRYIDTILGKTMENEQDELIGLIGRCAIRDQAALKLLFEKVGPYLNSVIYRILRSNETSSEVLQEAYLQIWTNASSYRPHLAKPLTWMASIARYRALDRLASEKRFRTNHVSIEEDVHLSDMTAQEEPETETAQAQLRFHLHECLATLSDNIKRSIELAYLYGYSREEIAEKFATNVNTVKSWLHRGAERLKLCLTAQHQ